MTVIITLSLLAAFLLMRMPVAFAMAISGAAGLYLFGGMPVVMATLGTAPLASASTYELMTIPMFLLMANLVVVSGYADELFDALNAWVGRLRGGLGVATIATGAGFAAITGSSVGSAATLSGTAVPQMVARGYDPRLASGLVSVVGTLAILIPPSNGLIIYGLIAGAPIGELLVAGLLPGVLAALALVVALQLTLRSGDITTPSNGVARRDQLRYVRSVGPMLLLFGAVTGVIFVGVGTPVEAAALGAFGALVLLAWRRRLTLRSLREALFGTARISAMITLIIAAAHIFGYFFTLTGVTQNLVASLSTWAGSRWVVLVLILLGYLLLGCFMDQIAILVLTLPVTLPVIEALGFDPVWFGVVVVVTAEIGLITPPLGLNVFVVARYTKQPLGEVFRGVAPFGAALVAVLAVLVSVPSFVLWLPGFMS